MISVNDFRTGLTISVDNALWQVLDFQHVKPGKGAAFVRSKLRNLRTGSVQEKTFRAGEKVEKAPLPGFTCWKSSTCQRALSTEIVKP
ncbi:hypothetical protein ACT4US_16380, partial [Bacillus sp. HC-Mk]